MCMLIKYEYGSMQFHEFTFCSLYLFCRELISLMSSAPKMQLQSSSPTVLNSSSIQCCEQKLWFTSRFYYKITGGQQTGGFEKSFFMDLLDCTSWNQICQERYDEWVWWCLVLFLSWLYVPAETVPMLWRRSRNGCPGFTVWLWDQVWEGRTCFWRMLRQERETSLLCSNWYSSGY